MVLFAFYNAQNGIIKVGKIGVITYGNDKKNNKNDSIILNTIEELVPQDHDAECWKAVSTGIYLPSCRKSLQ